MHLADRPPHAVSMAPPAAAAASGAHQQPQQKDSPLLELHALLLSAKGHMVPARALGIIRASSAEELAAYMLLLVTNNSAAAPAPASHRLTIALHDAASPPAPPAAAAAEGGPDSPRRCGKHDQQLGVGSSPEPAPSSGRCFLAESLDLNVGASQCDWLAKGSLADFSAATAAAAARASRSGLVGTSMAAQRMLSPVAENSLPAAAAAFDPQEEQPSSSSHGAAAAAAQPAWGDVPSCCSSPREGPPHQHQPDEVGRGALVRQSAAESALDWPRALPVAVDAFTVDAEDGASLASSAAPSPQPVQHQHVNRHNPPAAAARGQPGALLLPHYSEQQARAQGSFTSNASSNDSAGSSSKRGGGGGLGRALLAPVNALRRSLTGGRVAAAAPGNPPGRAGALQAAASKPLARGSAPLAGVYGHRAGAASPGGGSTSSRQHAVSPALGSRLASFTVTREGASPTKAAAAASGRKQPAGGWGGSGSSSRVTGNTSYRPPSTPCSTTSNRSPGAMVASSSRIGAGSKPASGGSRLPGATPSGQQQQQQFRRSPASDAGCGPHGSDLRSERSCPHYYGAASAAGSHTSGGGAIPGFRATKQMLDGAAHTPLARPQHARGAVAAAARANVRAQDKQVSPGVPAAARAQQQQGGRGGSPAGSTFSSRLQPSRLPSVFAGPTQQQQQQQHSVISVFAAGAAGQARGAASGGSRIGRGSQLRRSRSCGSLGELARAAATDPPARQQAQHSSGGGVAAGAADTAVLLEPGLPLLNLCASPTKQEARPWAEPEPVFAAGGSSSPGDPASLLLGRMDALIARAGRGQPAAATDDRDGCFLSPGAGGPHPLACKLLGAAARASPMHGGGGSTPSLDAANPVASPLDSPPLLSGCSAASRPTPIEASRHVGGAGAAADITRQLFQ